MTAKIKSSAHVLGFNAHILWLLFVLCLSKLADSQVVTVNLDGNPISVNPSSFLNSCDAVGVQDLNLIYDGATSTFGRLGGAQNFWFGAETTTGADFGGYAFFSVSTQPGAPGVCFFNSVIQTGGPPRRGGVFVGTRADGSLYRSTPSSNLLEAAEADYNNDDYLPFSGDQDDGRVLDIMIPYTPEALCHIATGGFCDVTLPTNIAAMEAVVDHFVAEANVVFMISQLDLTLRLVHTYRVTDFQEGANSFTVVLNQMQAENDNVFESLHSLRDQFCADVVGLIVRDAFRIGPLATFGQAKDIGADPDVYTFVTSLETAAIVGYTFTHELGHVMVCVCFELPVTSIAVWNPDLLSYQLLN